MNLCKDCTYCDIKVIPWACDHIKAKKRAKYDLLTGLEIKKPSRMSCREMRSKKKLCGKHGEYYKYWIT